MLGQTYEYWRKDICGLKKPIEGAHLLIGDTRANEGEMDHTMEKAGVIHVSHDQFACCNIWQKKVNDFAKDVDAIYLSVDVDILNKKYIPAYEKEVENGHDIETVMQNIHAVMNTGKVNAFSMFCLDFDHYEHGGKETYRNGMKLISSGLEAWKIQRYKNQNIQPGCLGKAPGLIIMGTFINPSRHICPAHFFVHSREHICNRVF